MKSLLGIILALLVFAMPLYGQRLPEREINTFAHFDPEATGQNDMNAYLLSYIARVIYQDPLGRDLGDPRRVSTNELFEVEFIDRTQHFFFDPTPPEPPQFTQKAPTAPCTRQGCACATYELAQTPVQKAASRVRQVRPRSVALASRTGASPKPLREARSSDRRIEWHRYRLPGVPPVPKVEPKAGAVLKATKGAVSACEAQKRTYIRALQRYKASYKSYERTYDRYLVALERWEATRPHYEFIRETGGQGYDPEAMLIATPDFVLVVFRGTDRVEGAADYFGYDVGEWIATDFDAPKVPPGNGLAGQVHRGFWTSLGFIRSELADAVIEAGGRQKPLWITGHSLGGAHAQLFAAYIARTRNVRAQGVYVYASPHVGNGAFVAQLNALLPGHRLQRFEFQDDPVTNVPLRSMFYDRAGTRNFYSREASSYYFDRDERALLPLPLDFCKHHTEWYVRAAYLALPQSQRRQVPQPPSRPTADFTACSATDVREAVNENIGN